jgi:hypothetical protein
MEAAQGGFARSALEVRKSEPNAATFHFGPIPKGLGDFGHQRRFGQRAGLQPSTLPEPCWLRKIAAANWSMFF